jgi:hypothetical protein
LPEGQGNGKSATAYRKEIIKAKYRHGTPADLNINLVESLTDFELGAPKVLEGICKFPDAAGDFDGCAVVMDTLPGVSGPDMSTVSLFAANHEVGEYREVVTTLET